MNIAAEARAAAMHFECKKDGLSQLQDGSWVLKIKVHPSDVPAALLTAPMGTRFVAALVEVADNETPVSPEAQAERSKPVKERKRWGELPLSQQAAIRCNEPEFDTFMRGRFTVHPDATIAEIVREACGILSRKELDEHNTAALRWTRLDADYRFWLQHRDISHDRT